MHNAYGWQLDQFASYLLASPSQYAWCLIAFCRDCCDLAAVPAIPHAQRAAPAGGPQPPQQVQLPCRATHWQAQVVLAPAAAAAPLLMSALQTRWLP